jgi:hypothetical protein
LTNCVNVRFSRKTSFMELIANRLEVKKKYKVNTNYHVLRKKLVQLAVEYACMYACMYDIRQFPKGCIALIRVTSIITADTLLFLCTSYL